MVVVKGSTNLYLQLSIGFLLGVSCFNLKEVERNPDQEHTYCGYQISEAIAAVCDGWYASSPVKRSVDFNFGLPEDTENDDEITFPFKSRLSARRFMVRFRRDVKYGVYNECCQKPCSYRELLTYCGDKP